MNKFLGIDLYQIVLHDRSNTYSIESVVDFVEQKLESQYYIVTQEKEEENKHFHIMVRTQVNKNDKSNRPIRKLIKEFGITGTGNSGTSLVKNKNQMMKYILKDGGDTRYRGVDKETILLMTKLSVKKGKFKVSKYSLEEQYMGTKMSFSTFADSYIKLELSYGYGMRPSSQKPYLTSVYLRKNTERISEYRAGLFQHDTFV